MVAEEVEEMIEVRGAREHNLRSVSLQIPKNRLVVFTGVSGSGKSSLAFDTLYAEGQRRYIESLSSFARQFLGQLPKPEVDYLGGLAPSISIEQKTSGNNPRSTVGTITEINDYLRVLFARIGQGHCPSCQQPIAAQSREQILARLLEFPEGTPLILLAPTVRNQKGEFKDYFTDLLRRGFVRARVDGKLVRLTDQLDLDRQMKHNIEVVIDRIVVHNKIRSRLAEAVEQALQLTGGTLLALIGDEAEESGRNKLAKTKSVVPRTQSELLLSSHYACMNCGLSFPPPTPQLFSFNNPQGMCLDCLGLGTQYTFDLETLIPDPTLSFRQGAIQLVGTWKEMGRWKRHVYQGVADSLGFSLTTPWKKLSSDAQNALLYGTGGRFITFKWKPSKGGRTQSHGDLWEGIIFHLLTKYRKLTNPMFRKMFEKYMRTVECPSCQGHRLNPQAQSVRVAGQTIVELSGMAIDELARFFQHEVPAKLTPLEWRIGAEVVKEIRARLGFLENVGLNYLTLERTAPTLSGGELQRIRLASQIGSGLTGVLYVLDEPSIGLHPRDNDRLIQTLQELRDKGNTVIVVEHDEATMRSADYLVDFGPGPGVRGGEVVAHGTLSELMASPRSLTGQYLSGDRTIPIPTRRPIAADTCPTLTPSSPQQPNQQNDVLTAPVEIPASATTPAPATTPAAKPKRKMAASKLSDEPKHVAAPTTKTKRAQQSKTDSLSSAVPKKRGRPKS